MSKYLIIGGIILLAVLGYFVFFHNHIQQNPLPNPGGSTTTSPFPGGSNGNGNNGGQGSTTPPSSTLSVAAYNGAQINVNDFRNIPGVEPDTSNPGNYILAGGDNASQSAYEIYYFASDKSFDVALLQEPIGAARLQAEKDLMQKLGIDQTTMCRLKYWVGVPNAINQFYSGKNLGFSFCPGATQLPD